MCDLVTECPHGTERVDPLSRGERTDHFLAGKHPPRSYSDAGVDTGSAVLFTLLVSDSQPIVSFLNN